MKIRFIRDYSTKYLTGTVKEFADETAEFYLKNNFAEIYQKPVKTEIAEPKEK